MLAIMIGVEMLWRRKLIKGEYGRKLLHVTLTVFVATWPFYLPWDAIQFLSLGAVGFAVLMRLTYTFHSLYDVKRKSLGDLIGPATIAVLAFMQPDPWVFAAAVLHIALADGLAAVVGTRYGAKNTYFIFGQRKSIAGTLTFVIVSAAIIVWLMLISPLTFTSDVWLGLIWLPFMAALAENISPYGFDNLTIGLLVTVSLNALT